MAIAPYELVQKQSLPLDCKVRLATLRIEQWHERFAGKTYVAFSGGKDSTVLLHLVRAMYPDTPAVFFDTGLEFPEIRDFVSTIPNVTWMKPKMTFRSVLSTHGYPVVSKRVARYVNDLVRESPKNTSTCNLRRTGMNRAGEYCPSMKLSKKWMYLVGAPFRISDKCCKIMKHQPASLYCKTTGRKAMTGEMASDSRGRAKTYLRHGCNSFDSKTPVSRPLSVWNESDVWEYLKTENVPYSKIYDMGYHRTGCAFCAFGAHLEKPPNRFQLMKTTHPKLWEYCMTKLGMREVLDFIGVKYEP